jgi:hypothetical protein
MVGKRRKSLESPSYIQAEENDSGDVWTKNSEETSSCSIHESRILSEKQLSSPPADLITDLNGFEEVREDETFELFAAKFSNPGVTIKKSGRYLTIE